MKTLVLSFDIYECHLFEKKRAGFKKKKGNKKISLEYQLFFHLSLK